MDDFHRFNGSDSVLRSRKGDRGLRGFILASLALSALLFPSGVRAQEPGTIVTVAGGAPVSLGLPADGSLGVDTRLFSPEVIATGPDGNVYFDWNDEYIYRLTQDGRLFRVAGGGGSREDNIPADEFNFGALRSLAVDRSGIVYVGEVSSIYRVDVSGVLTKIAGGGSIRGGEGVLALASSVNPRGLTLDSRDNLFLAMGSTCPCVQRLDGSGILTTPIGDASSFRGFGGDGGFAKNIRLDNPRGIAFDSDDNLYIADSGNYRIRKVSRNGIVSTFAGNGTQGFRGDGGLAVQAQLARPIDVAVDSANNVFILDIDNQTVRVVDPAGIIRTVAGGGSGLGDGGPGTSARLNRPEDIAIDSHDNLYIADTRHHRIRKVFAQTQRRVPPMVGPMGVVNAASFEAGPLTPNMWVTLFGSALAEENCSSGPAFVVCGVRVFVNGQPALVSLVSPGQINFLMPSIGSVGNAVIVVVGLGPGGNELARSEEVRVPLAASAPGLFQFQGSPIVTSNADFSLVTPENPLPAGGAFNLWGTGFGLSPNVQVFINGREARVTFAGDSGFAGLIQVNAVAPAEVTGFASFRVVVNGIVVADTLIAIAG